MTDLATSLGMSVPIVAAPMAGGPSTPELVAAVGEAGGLGFLPAGYQDAGWLRQQIEAVRELTRRPFGVNVFLPGPEGADPRAIQAYADRIRPVATKLGVELGEPRWDDDGYPAKLELLAEDPPAVVSFTFGCPRAEDVARLRDAGAAVLITVTTPEEAAEAARRGPDGLCVQGAEAGAHRGSFVDDGSAAPGAGALPLRNLLLGVRQVTDLPMIATGGLMNGGALARMLALGADAGQFGTAFLGCPEAGTNDTHRKALYSPHYSRTAFTRAFTGRTARAIVNEFHAEHTEDAPVGYPQVHHLTRPVRTAAARQGDPEALHLWAGTGWRELRPMPAGELVRLLANELAAARSAAGTT
jgi:nitronate monooxygenase